MKASATTRRDARTFSSADYLRRLMSELDRAAICRRIAEAREEAGLTQPELADALTPPVHWRTVQTWERGEKDKTGQLRWTVPFKQLGQIAELTATTKEWLLHGKVQQPAPLADVALAQVLERLDRIEQAVDLLVARAGLGGQESQPG